MRKKANRTPFGVAMKFWLFRHYWWLFSLMLMAILGYGLVEQLRFIDLAPFLAVVLSGFYFLQKQKLEELKMFKELFESFNARYDEMNSQLDDINTTQADQLSKEEKHTLTDYFNLCAEEYLYFCKGYIYPEVWGAWYNGMLFYLANPRIKRFWEEDRPQTRIMDLDSMAVRLELQARVFLPGSRTKLAPSTGAMFSGLRESEIVIVNPLDLQSMPTPKLS